MQTELSRQEQANNLQLFREISATREAKDEFWHSQAVNISLESCIDANLGSIENAHSHRSYKGTLGQVREFLESKGLVNLGDLARLIAPELVACFEQFLDHKLKEGVNGITVQHYKSCILQWLRFLQAEFPSLITMVPSLNQDRHRAYYSRGVTENLNWEEWYELKKVMLSQQRPSKNNPQLLVKDRQWRAKAKYFALCSSALLLGGRRLAELLSLTWQDCHFDQGFVWVSPKKKRADLSRVKLPCNPQLQEVLETYKATWKTSPQPSDLIFPNTSQQSTDQALRAYAKKAGIQKNISFHSLRVTFITWGLEQGDSISELLNSTLHSNAQMIRYYDRTDALRTSSILKMRRV